MGFTNTPNSPRDCSAWFNETVDCDQPTFGSFESNADIAGPGILWSFGIAMVLTFVVSVILLGIELCEYWLTDGGQSRFQRRQERKAKDQWRRLFDSFLVSLSDTQIVTGISLSAVTLWGCACTISAYHYDLVCGLVLMAAVVHLCSITVLDKYFEVIWLAAIRLIAILISFILGLLVFIQRAPKHFPVAVPSAKFDNSTRLVLPAVCSMSGNNITTTATSSKDTTDYSAFAEYIILLILYVLALAITFYQKTIARDDAHFKHHRGIYIIRIFFAVLSLIFGFFALSKVIKLSGWMMESGWFGEDDGESNWKTFGQLVPLIMLTLSVLSFLEALADKTSDSDSDGKDE